MGKIKMPTKTPTIDMTPMVDLFFLLLTFFMLTTTFRPQEAVQVDTPTSISETVTPERHIITLLVAKDNRVFFNVDQGIDTSEHVRGKVLQAMGSQYQIRFEPAEIKKFEGLASFGLPVNKLKEWLNAPDQAARDVMETGIPMDSIDNQLFMWIRFARTYNSNLEVAIKGDGQSDYKTIKRVMDILQDNNVNKFNLTTNLEKVEVKMENL
jgi:biopolymer transport protein ExbD